MTPPSESSSPQKEVLAVLHGRWRLVLFVPVLYLMLGLWLSSAYFQPVRGGKGFLPVGPEAMGVLLFLAALFAGMAWGVGRWVARRHRLELLLLSIDRTAWRARALEQQLIGFVFCDLIAAPGIILFLLEGEQGALVLFVLLSMVAYLERIPRRSSLPYVESADLGHKSE